MDACYLIFVIIKNTQKYKIFSCSQNADPHINRFIYQFTAVIYLFMRHECQRMSAGEAKIYY